MSRKTYRISKLKGNNFSLVLSGGSSLGLAHIGTIKFLEEHSLNPSEIVGTSMGSIIGALYALGETSETIQGKLENLSTHDLFQIKYLQGRIDYKNAKSLLKKLFRETKIQDAKIPLKIIATKLKNGEEKIFTKKDNIKIYNAILASIAIPGILNAEKIRGEPYIDGCVSSNLPIEAAEKNNIKLAVNVVNRKKRDYSYKDPSTSLIKNLITKFEIIRHSSSYYIINQTESKATKTKKLILIEPDLRRFNPIELKNYKKIIQEGYTETKKYFDKAERESRIKQKKRKLTPLEKMIRSPFTKAKKMIRKLKNKPSL